ncbi:MAG TPA: hypothetical protein VGT41_00300 [Candidatus Babeliales bacterium]|nr:hypothetical protein [Candidatus Babeliales bacterium]
MKTRQEIRRLQQLGEFQQARAGEDAAARREAVGKKEPLDTSLVTDFGLDEPETQQAIAESLNPQKKPARTKKLTKETKEEDEKERETRNPDYRTYKDKLREQEREDVAARELRGGRPVEHTDVDLRKLISTVPMAVSEHMKPYIVKKGSTFLDKDAEVISTIIKTKHPITCLGISIDSKSICGASENGAVYVWDAITEKLIHKFDSGIKKPLALSGDGKAIVTGDNANNRIFIWDAVTKTKTSKMIRDIEKIEPLLMSAAITADGTIVVMRSSNALPIWYVATGEIRRMPVGLGIVESIAVRCDGKQIAVGINHSRKVHIFDANTGNVVHEISTRATEEIAVAPDGSFIVAAAHRYIGIWNVITGERIQALESPDEQQQGWLNNIAISGDGSFIVGAYKFGIHIWRLKSSLVNVAYASRGYALDEAEKLRHQAKAISEFPEKRLRAINKEVALLKSADVSRKDLEAYFGEIKNRTNQELAKGMQESIPLSIAHIKSVQERANATKDFPDELKEAIDNEVKRVRQADQSQPNFGALANTAVQKVDQLLEEGLQEIRRQNLLASDLGGMGGF